MKMGLGIFFTSGKDEPPKEGERAVEVFMCSVVNKMGYREGLEWLVSHFQN